MNIQPQLYIRLYTVNNTDDIYMFRVNNENTRTLCEIC